MSFIDRFIIRLTCKFVGEDDFGNRYFVGKDKNYLGQSKRYVLYKGKEPDPTTVPPRAHAWLHYMCDKFPEARVQDVNYAWQKEHVPNLTGTSKAYSLGGEAGRKPHANLAPRSNYVPEF